MKVVIFGLGYVGFTAACCIASEGHDVVGIDVSARKVAGINAGKSPIVEKKVDEMLAEALREGRIEARSEIGDALDGADIAIVCVGTPSAADGSHNIGYIADVTRNRHLPQDEARPAPPSASYTAPPSAPARSRNSCCRFRSVLGEGTDERAASSTTRIPAGGQRVQDYFGPRRSSSARATTPRSGHGSAEHQRPGTVSASGTGRRTDEVRRRYLARGEGRLRQRDRTGLPAARHRREEGPRDLRQRHQLDISPYYTLPRRAFVVPACRDVPALAHIGADTGANLHLIDSLLRSNEAHKHRLFQYRPSGGAWRADPDGGARLQGRHRRPARARTSTWPASSWPRQRPAHLRSRHRRRHADRRQSGLRLQPAPEPRAPARHQGRGEGHDLDRVPATNATIKALDLPRQTVLDWDR